MSNTQISRAKNGEITPQMEAVAAKEYQSPEFIREKVAAGHIVIPANIHHENLNPIGIGSALTTKINANIGNSALSSCPQQELEKLKPSLKLFTSYQRPIKKLPYPSLFHQTSLMLILS